MNAAQQAMPWGALSGADSYVIDPEVDGARLSKTSQIRMCGNSVCPPVAQALVEANITAGRVRKGQLELGLSGAA